MGIVKLIVVVLVVWLGFVLFKKLRKPKSELSQESSNNKMLACSVCQTHVPENEAIIHNSKVFCSTKCME